MLLPFSDTSSTGSYGISFHFVRRIGWGTVHDVSNPLSQTSSPTMEEASKVVSSISVLDVPARLSGVGFLSSLGSDERVSAHCRKLILTFLKDNFFWYRCTSGISADAKVTSTTCCSMLSNASIRFLRPHNYSCTNYWNQYRPMR